MPRVSSAAEAVAAIQPGQRVFVHGAAATPHGLVAALCERAAELPGLELIHLHTSGPAPHGDVPAFRIANLFVGGNLRSRFDRDRIDYIPMFLSEIPALFRSRRRPLDVALVQVSPPDKHGLCTLGTSVDVAAAAVEVAPVVIAQVNPRMPRVHGDGVVRLSSLSAWYEDATPLPECPPAALGPIERAIGRQVAPLVEDGATLQMGIGAIPDAVLAELKDRRGLGIHTEMWSDGALDLIECGAVDNSRKTVHPDRSISAFLMGTQRLYDFVDDNPSVMQLDIAYVNRVDVIARNPKVVAINSAVEVDLTGQVCADSIGDRIISGVGGQMDFIRGASLSRGGRPIIALPSRTRKGGSRIVPRLRAGAGVVTTRGHVHWVATEYGLADLYGKTLAERARALIDIAHPDDREALAKAWRDSAHASKGSDAT